MIIPYAQSPVDSLPAVLEHWCLATESNPGPRVRQHENTNTIVTCLILDAQRIRTFPTTAAPGAPGIHWGCGMALDRHVEAEVSRRRAWDGTRQSDPDRQFRQCTPLTKFT